LEDLPLFAATNPAPEGVATPSTLEQALLDLDPDQLTPREALDFVYALKKML
jgi:DNA mismatch repair protein MutS